MVKGLVTVIVPAYNASMYIRETLESISGQSYRKIEVIVVDDGSTDDTATIVKSFDKVRYFYQKNSGSCASPRNTGISHARGEYITFFDADDIMLPQKIACQINDLKQHPDAIMSICNYQNFLDQEVGADHFSTCPVLTGELLKTGTKSVSLDSNLCRFILINENFSSANSPLIRANALAKAGGFDESLTACEDYHLNYRLAALGPVIVNSEIGFHRRIHELNMSSDNDRMLRNFIRSRESLIQQENDNALEQLIRIRVRQVLRSLQQCLVRKGETAEALRIYRRTFPPNSLREIAFDVKQVLKILLFKIGVIKPN